MNKCQSQNLVFFFTLKIHGDFSNLRKIYSMYRNIISSYDTAKFSLYVIKILSWPHEWTMSYSVL